MARTSSNAIIASTAAVRVNDLEVAMAPLLNLVSAPARCRCFLSLPTDCRRWIDNLQSPGLVLS